MKGKENGETLLQILQAADTDKSGQIDYTEFLAATMDAQIFLRNDYLRTAFDMFDKDKSGKIDIGEISEMLGEDGM
jgi:calcium-dependent protein kinase